MAANEHLEIACDVEANPNDLKFHWTFSNRTRNMNYNEDFRYSGSIQKRQFNSEDESGNGYLTSYLSNGTRSILTYSPGEVTRLNVFLDITFIVEYIFLLTRSYHKDQGFCVYFY